MVWHYGKNYETGKGRVILVLPLPALSRVAILGCALGGRCTSALTVGAEEGVRVSEESLISG